MLNCLRKSSAYFIVLVFFLLRMIESQAPVREYGRVYYQLGLDSVKQRAFPNARGYFLKAIQSNWDLDSAHHQLSEIYLKEGDVDKAIQAAQNAVIINPFLYAAYNVLGLAFDRKGQYPTAISYFRKAIPWPYPKEVSTYFYNMGLTYVHMGDTNAAAEQISTLNYIGFRELAEKLEGQMRLRQAL